MIIENPIFDVVFKRLMENDKLIEELRNKLKNCTII
jgi:hypothetical protein